jgi:hypothetical protein
MQLHTKEHGEMIKQFEKHFPGRHDKEHKDMWPKGVIYQNGEMNNMFKVFCVGYSVARCEYL